MNIVWLTLLSLRNFRYLFIKPKQKKVLLKIPFYSQLDTGVKEKYSNWLWQTNGCGMACLKMILKHQGKKVFSTSELGEMCKKYGGFIDNSANPDKMDGLFYKPFVEFVRKEFDLEARVISPMIISKIIRELELGNYVIASVSSKIRNTDDIPSKKGGHLVLVVGFDWVSQILLINNPSFPQKTKMPTPISFADFSKFFANRGIVIKAYS